MSASFDGVELDQLCMAGTFALVTIHEGSCLTFYRGDATYGNGFAGNVDASFGEVKAAFED